jgi:hypothetical protein
MSVVEQCERTIKVYIDNLWDLLDTEAEHSALEKMKQRLLRMIENTDGQSTEQPGIDSVTIGEALYRLKQDAEECISKEAGEFLYCKAYHSEYIDSLCASLGYIYAEAVGRRERGDSSAQTGAKACAVVDKLPLSDEMHEAIAELIETHLTMPIDIILTDTTDTGGDHEMISKSKEMLSAKYPNISVMAAPDDPDGKWLFLVNCLSGSNYSKVYCCTSHTDTFSAAAIHFASGKVIVPLSRVCGLICGISNPRIDCVIIRGSAIDNVLIDVDLVNDRMRLEQRINELTQTIESLGSEMTAMEHTVSNQSSTIEELKTKNDKLSGQAAKQRRSIKRLKESSEKKERKLKKIQASKAYRLGRMATFIPRKLRRLTGRKD